MQSHSTFDRIALIVLDSLGVGAMPDAAAIGDEDSDTLGHICEHRSVEIPHLQLLGIGNIRPLAHVPPVERPQGAYGRLASASNGKDTTTGHWEMAGIRIEKASPTYPDGFPREIIEAFEKAIDPPYPILLD